MRFLSREAFDANHEDIQLAVRLLVADPERRKRFRIATVYERDSDELLAEVLEANPGLVVAYSARVGGAMANWAPGRDIVLHDRQHRPYRMVSPLTGADDQTVTVMTRLNVPHELRVANLIRFIEGGQRSGEEGALVFRRGTARPSGHNSR